MKISDVLMCAGLAAFFLIATAWLPFAGPFVSMLTPLPYLYYSTKLGFSNGVKITFLSTLILTLLAFLAGYPQITLFAVEFGLLGLMLSWLFFRKFSFSQTLFFATLCILFLGFGFFFYFASSKHISLREMMRVHLDSQVKAVIMLYKDMSVPEEKIAELDAYGKVFINTVLNIYPSLMVVGTGFIVWFNMVLAKPLFRMKKLDYPDFGPMDHWKAPDILVWGVILSGFTYFISSGSIKLFALNALIIMMTVYFFHGLAIILFFLNKYHAPSWFRASVFFLIIIQQLFLITSAAFGLFDQWIDFRKIHSKMDN
ncbi:MAG: DUF2232 domain-containing protein [Deltaproteobacteria bacterium]|nr:DUF2232 domain-containing protein [Deltaproteobacteria bacterium]